MANFFNDTGLPEGQKAIREKCFHPSGTFIELRREEIEQSIPDRFEQIVRKHPDRLALKTRTHVLTYAELNQAANHIAHSLLALRGDNREPIALLFENGAAFVIASLGVLKAGKIQVPLESTFPQARLGYMLEQSQATALVTNSANLPQARDLGTVPLINVDEIDGCFATTDPGLSLPPDAIAAIEYTSGSTGRPKGITRNHRGVLHAIMQHTNISHMCMHDRVAMFRAALRSYLYALLNGAAFYPVDLHKEEPAHLADWLIREEITVYRAAVSALRSFATALTGAKTFSHLRLIFVFGEPTYTADVELYRKYFSDRCILASSLGCNEFGDYAYYLVDKNSSLPSGIVPGGYPIDDAEIMLLDGDGRPVGVDQIGEIAIRSRYGAVGYWRRPDLTQAAFLADPDDSNKRIYRTGDLGRVRSDGCLLHVGRKDFQVKIRGHRVEVAEVETALLEVDGVKEALVVGWTAGPGDKRLAAYIVPVGTRAPSVSELRRILGDKLPDYMVPSIFVTLDTLPLTVTGKVDRRALPAPDQARPEPEETFVASRTPVEELLCGMWAEVLKLEKIGIHDNFFDLGGHSLLATQVISQIINKFQLDLPVRSLFQAPTVAEIAAVITEHQANKWDDKDLDGILAELESLSDEEARRLAGKEDGG